MRKVNLLKKVHINQPERHGKYVMQQGGLFMLLWCLLLSGLLSAATPVGNAFHIPEVIAKAAQAVSMGQKDEAREKVLKIQTILQKFETGLPSDHEAELAHHIYRESLEHAYDPELILALAVTESSFYNWAKSRVGALGLLQILPATGRELARVKNIPWNGKKTLFDPQLNVRLGTHYLATLHRQFGDLEIALAAYNYGPSRIARLQKRGKRLPVVYPGRVLTAYQVFMQLDTLDKAEAWKPKDLRSAPKSYRVASVRL